MHPLIPTVVFLAFLTLSSPQCSASARSHAPIPPSTAPSQPAFPWFDPTLPIPSRVRALISALSLPQKVAQLTGGDNAVPSLGLPQFAWCSEGSHGVARAGRATVFPSPIGLGATFDDPLVLQAGRVLAVEARAKNQDYEKAHHNDSVIWYGVNFFAPNIKSDAPSTHTRTAACPPFPPPPPAWPVAVSHSE